MNCPGSVGFKGLVGKELAELIDGYSLTQYVKSPTHKSGNILDHVLSPAGAVSIDCITVDEVGFSDHSLITCKVAVDIKWQLIIRATFRNWKKLDLDMFRQRVRASSAFINPTNPVVKFASQVESDTVNILDELAPLCTSTKKTTKTRKQMVVG